MVGLFEILLEAQVGAQHRVPLPPVQKLQVHHEVRQFELARPYSTCSSLSALSEGRCLIGLGAATWFCLPLTKDVDERADPCATDDRRYLTRRILREIQHACDRASAYLLAREEVVSDCGVCWESTL